MTLAGRTALVTGAARGIGLAIAARPAADGARVALDQDAAALETAARSVGPGALALVGDVTRAKDVDGAVARVERAWGRLDVLVNNAGRVVLAAIAADPTQASLHDLLGDLYARTGLAREADEAHEQARALAAPGLR
ncbi:MAG TPA: SDR family NAD(P)-dependent oxidoreductase [Methylomirabilota bacterium]|nr:SDR family NAD(P)-dependent oxidoreductase [Methylomirabilota bacterium]